jgi:hypothetical protein
MRRRTGSDGGFGRQRGVPEVDDSSHLLAAANRTVSNLHQQVRQARRCADTLTREADDLQGLDTLATPRADTTARHGDRGRYAARDCVNPPRVGDSRRGATLSGGRVLAGPHVCCPDRGRRFGIGAVVWMADTPLARGLLEEKERWPIRLRPTCGAVLAAAREEGRR